MPSYAAGKVSKLLGAFQRHPQLVQPANSNAVHPFPARMPLALAHFLIEHLSTPGAVVLDPMAGSGTTLIAAKQSGRVGIGFDLDPLAVMLALAATTTADPALLLETANRVLENANALLSQPGWATQQRALRLGHEEQRFADYWFPLQAQHQLLALSAAIQAEEGWSERAFLWAVFSSLIIAKSAGASHARDLAHSRPHRDLTKPVVLPLVEWTARFRRAVARRVFPSGALGLGACAVQPGDARCLPLADATVDFILTSPPYLHAIDYLRAHKFALLWMGYSLSALRQLRTTMIGAERMLPGPNGLPHDIEHLLNETIPLSARRGRVRRYLSDLHRALAEMARVLKPGALAVVVVGPSLLGPERDDAVALLDGLAASVGLALVDTVARPLPDKYRALPPPRRVPGDNRLQKRLRTEVLVVLSKPGRGAPS